MPLQQADDCQRQQQDQRQIARIEKARAQFFQNIAQRHQRGKAGDEAGDNHHQHRIEAQQKADDDCRNAQKRPEVYHVVHVYPYVEKARR